MGEAQEHWDRLVCLLRDAANKGYAKAKNVLDKHGLGLGSETED